MNHKLRLFSRVAMLGGACLLASCDDHSTAVVRSTSRPAEATGPMTEPAKPPEIVAAAGTQPAADPAFTEFMKTGGKLVTLPDGLQYEDIKVGTGASPKMGHSVTVNYVGWLSNGQRFDGNDGMSFTVGQVIAGWNEGLLPMKIGGIRKLIIPAKLGYGDSGSPPRIPPGATLVFKVELLAVE